MAIELTARIREAKPEEQRQREQQTCPVCRKARGIRWMVHAIVPGELRRFAIGATLHESRGADVVLPPHPCCSRECADAKAAELIVSGIGPRG